MRKLLFVIALLLAQVCAMAQGANDAAISNILSGMPAQNSQQQNKSMEAITALGENGIVDLISWLKEKGDNTALEYAIGGYAYYVTLPGRQAQRTTAVKAYSTALDKVAGPVNKQFIIKQLQQMGTDAAVPALKKYLSDEKLSGAAARALLAIGSPAAKAALQGDEKDTKVIIFQPANASGQVQTRIAELYAIVKAKGRGSMPTLFKAMKDEDAQYRQAALWYAAKYQSPDMDKQWLGMLPGLSTQAKVQVINFVASSKDAMMLPPFIALLKNDDKSVRLAAIAAAGKVGNQRALSSLLNVMKKGDSDEVLAVENALFMMKGDGVVNEVVAAYPAMPETAKAALLDVIAARQYSNAVSLMITEIKGKSPSLAERAGNDLAYVVGQKDLPVLFNLLNENVQTIGVRWAIIRASFDIEDTLQRSRLIIAAMEKAPADKKILYLGPLAVSGGKEALSIIDSYSKNGTYNDVIEALSKSREAKATRILLKIIKDNSGDTQTNAVNTFIEVVDRAPFPADEKLLMLKEVMPFTNTAKQQADIMSQVADFNSFLALVYAGEFLDKGMAKEQAARAVANIAVSHNEFNGELVKTLLTKAAAVLTSKDDDYTRKAITQRLESMPAGIGFVSMFNGKDLSGWKGLVENPIARAKMPADTLKAKQEAADKVMNAGWFVKDGNLVFSGHGDNLCTVQQYTDFDMYVDWKIGPEGDAGIYLRGSPQVQVWDTSRRNVGAQVGSGGLYNNAKYQSKPLVLADNSIGEWNTFHIVMRDDKVTVYLNGVLVVDNVTLENYWDRKIPIFPKEQIELQAHGNVIYYRDLYIKELSSTDPVALSVQERRDGFSSLFNGANLNEWTGDKSGYKIDNDGSIMVDTMATNHPGNMYTKDEYGNFALRFQFMLTPGANNGIGIRAPLDGDAAYVGMEIQVLDNEAPVYKDLHEYQYHGSVYGVIPAKRGFLKPTGEWNEEEIVANGSHIKVTLNGEVILDGDIAEASKNGTADKREHPGLKRNTGHIGFLGHGSMVKFKNVRIKTL